MTTYRLRHGTTRHRAELIIKLGPDPDYREGPGAAPGLGFSACVASGPFPLGTPEAYARTKDALFPQEGGPVILEFEITAELAAAADPDGLMPLVYGVVQFDQSAGLAELLAVWPSLPKVIVDVR